MFFKEVNIAATIHFFIPDQIYSTAAAVKGEIFTMVKSLVKKRLNGDEGQEKEEVRKALRENPPQVLLTNYMMLELLLTRVQERSIRDAIYENLRFLVFDELHTYRGRQGADVAMLIRRIRAQCKQHTTCIGTSATMVSVGSLASQREQVAQVATTVFGRQFRPDQVVNETLTLSGIPDVAWSYKLGNRSALEWLIDQYQIDGDNDPNAYSDDPMYIVNLIERVTYVSVKTMEIVGELKIEN
jgi:hypothetical protein